jgi:HK97 family phage prohead protease
MLVRKTRSSESESGLEFIFSTFDEDRYGDRIVQNWDLKNFNRNPIALFNHNSNAPIGRWKNVRVLDGVLRGELVLAPDGTSPRVDEIRRLTEAGILKSVSVGFKPLEFEPLASGGTKYIHSELVEVSLVSVPANPHAVAVSKMLGVSKETIQMVFNRNNKAITVSGRNNTATISERIAQARRAVAVLEKAKAVLEKSEARDRADRLAKAKTASKQKPPKPPEPHGGITWRGQKIPASWFYPQARKNWGDPNS